MPIRAADAGFARRVAGLALLASAFAVLAAAPRPAQASAELAAKRNCLGCHHAVQRRAGPTLQAIAKRYNAIPDPKLREAAIDGLARKVRNGGRGAWGVVPMPGNSQVTEAESKQLVLWILEAHR